MKSLISGHVSLPVCTQPPPPGYGRVGPDVNFPGVKWYDGRKALFTLDVACDSTLHILDPSIHMFFKHLVAVQQLNGSFCTIAGKRIPIGQLPESLCNSIRDLASRSKLAELVHHLYLVVDGLLSLIVTPPVSDRVVISQCAFSTLATIVSRFHKDPRLDIDENGRCIELERFVYYSDATERFTEDKMKDLKVEGMGTVIFNLFLMVKQDYV